MSADVSRRDLLVFAGGAAIAASVGVPSLAPASDSGWEIVIDPAVPAEGLAAAGTLLDVSRARALGLDLVWEWRSGLRERVQQHGAMAVTRWDKAVILCGLAREDRLGLRQRALGSSCFLTAIGLPRPTPL